MYDFTHTYTPVSYTHLDVYKRQTSQHKRVGNSRKKVEWQSNGSRTVCKDFNRFVLDENLQPAQIYNSNKSGLFWKSFPMKTLASENEKSVPGHTVSKERITVMCFLTRLGHKLKLLVIGKKNTII